MKHLLLLAFFLGSLDATPIKVPQERYPLSANLRSHPGHYPFISYLTFRNICDHLIDQSTEWFDPSCVKQGEMIYLNIWYMDWFLEEVHPAIKEPYILLTADVGDYLPKPEWQQLLYDPKLAAWFCRNLLFSHHPKLHQIPMGQDMALFQEDPSAIDNLKNAVKALPLPKKHLLYMCFFPRPFGDRDKIVRLFENRPFCFTRNRSDQPWLFLEQKQFYHDVASSTFVLSPLGLETDCVRTWEALSLHSIPIVEHTFLDPIYEGLPVVKVHRWEEIDEPFLRKQYEKVKGLSLEKASFDYWKTLIKAVQKKVKEGDLAFSYLDATAFSAQECADLEQLLRGRGPHLMHIGFLTGVRSLQLATFSKECTQVFLYDPFLCHDTFQSYASFLLQPNYLRQRHLVYLLTQQKQTLEVASRCDAVFIDLTHYRQSLFFDLSDLRHRLKNDLTSVYLQLPSGKLLCGNCREDEYVSEVLVQIQEQLGFSFKKLGHFWFVVKA